MTKKILSMLLACIMLVSCAVFTVNAADETAYYVEEGATGGDGSEDEPFGTIEEAIFALEGKDGTIYVVDSYNMTKFKLQEGWEGMVTIKGADEDAVIVVDKSMGLKFFGDITFKDIKFEIGAHAHFNPIGTKLIMDGGEDSDFGYMMHLTSCENHVVEEAYAEVNSGTIATLYVGGGYSTSYANGCMGDSTLVVNGGTIKQICFAGDHYKEDQTGISVGGNLSVVINGGEINSMTNKENTPPEVMGALNVIFNNGMQAPSKFVYPEETIAGGVFIIKSAEGGKVMPTAEVGVFEITADKGKVAVINGEQVFDGTVTLEAGETEVTWEAGEQPSKEEPIEIKLTIDSKEIVVNGEAKELDVPAQIVDSRTLVPLRAIFEALGASVEWNGETSTVTSAKGDTSVKLTIGENKIYVNDEAKELDVAAQIIESRTMVPARAVAEAYGCNVAWDGDTRTVIITK